MEAVFDKDVYVKDWPTIGRVVEERNGRLCVIFNEGGNGWYDPSEVHALPEWAKEGVRVCNRKTGARAIITSIYDDHAKGRYEVLEEGQEYATYINVWDIENLYQPLNQKNL